MDKVTIVFNSCTKYAGVTVTPLLYQLAALNPGYKIMFVLGGHEEYRVEVADTTTFVSTPVNSFDFTGLITIVEHPELITTPYIFYMHDTVSLGKSFFEKIQTTDFEANKFPPAICFEFPSANIGFYRMSFLLESVPKTILAHLKNTDSSEEKLQAFKHFMIMLEDILFKLYPKKALRFPHKPKPLWGEEVFPYGSTTPRIRELYEDMDFCKYKASWSPAEHYNITP